MAYNKLQTMRDNIEAIRLALRLDVEHRNAENALEREILRKYAGFGGLKCILQDGDTAQVCRIRRAEMYLAGRQRTCRCRQVEQERH